MEEMSHEDAISTFQSITGADEKTAEHVLEAHAWDLNRGVNFFMESANSIPAAQADFDVNGQRGGNFGQVYEPSSPRSTDGQRYESPRNRRRPGRVESPSNVTNGREYQEDSEPPNHFRNRHVPYQVLQEEREKRSDSEQNRNNTNRVGSNGINLSSDEEDDDFNVVEASNNPIPSGGRPNKELNSHQIEDFLRNDEEESERNFNEGYEEFRGRRTDASRSIEPAFGPSQFPFGMPSFPRPNLRGPQHANSAEIDSSLLPEGIDVEEARMLEAAMMGIPYSGRIPEFNESNRNNVPEDPNVIQERLLREEQDQAYQDSLLADIEKKSAEEAIQRAEEDKRLQIEQEKLAAEQAQRDYEQDIEEKLLKLPEEPASNVEGAITVMIRTPKGARFGRRFLIGNSVNDLFCFVDISAAPDFKPGTYQLVTQFPRKVLNNSMQMTLAEAGLNQKQEALFLEAP